AQQLDPKFWRTDGYVSATALAGRTLYIGGGFSHVGPATGGAPPDASSGGALPGFPRVHGSVSAVAVDGSGGWFIGGEFDSVGGLARQNVAHIRADLSVAAWSPNANSRVRTLAVSGGTVYASGDFSSIGGSSAATSPRWTRPPGWPPRGTRGRMVTSLPLP